MKTIRRDPAAEAELEEILKRNSDNVKELKARLRLRDNRVLELEAELKLIKLDKDRLLEKLMWGGTE